MNKVLVLGAGLVSRPLVRYLLEHGCAVTVADVVAARAEQVVGGHPNGLSIALDIDDPQALRAQVARADLVVSLLPAPRHPEVARACLEARRHMVTASYTSPAMRALDAEARQKNLLLLNEVGVDPGLDHMSALKVIRAEEQKGATLTGFTSWCGGLPAPEASGNPFKYKFSWSPRGVLVAATRSARFLKDGAVVEIPADRLFAAPTTVEIAGVGTFEGYPNRDSVSYIETYGFSPKVKTLLRGTLRNAGHCALYTQIVRLGLLQEEPLLDFAGLTYRGLMDRLFGAPAQEAIPAKLGVAPEASPLAALKSIGLFDDRPIEIARGALVDLMADRMSKALAFLPGERDMLLMRHDFEFVRAGKRERVTAALVDYGIPHGDTSMARTVSLPAAICVRLALEGKIALRGVQIPVHEQIFLPVLEELESMGISFVETRQAL